MLDKIKKASKKGLMVCPVGVGSAFARKNYNSSFILAKDEQTLLVDLGRNVPDALHKKGIKVTDFDYYYFTHAHADHVGGVEELLLMSRYVIKQKPKIFMDLHFKGILWHNTLSGGIKDSEEKPLSFDDMADIIEPIDIEDSGECYFEAGPFKLETQPVKHVAGSKFRSENVIVNSEIYISGDAIFQPDIIESAERFNNLRIMFHDCQLFEPGAVHASYDELKRLPITMKEKMYLYHYGDNFEDFKPEEDGFKGFAKAWEVY